MNPESLKALFAALLDRQLESGDSQPLGKARIRENLTTGPGLSDEEKQQLIASPLARYQYLDIQAQVAKEIRGVLQNAGIDTRILPLAAAEQATDTHVFSCTGYKVILQDKSRHGIPWVILLQLDKAFQDAINPFTVLRLVDSGGLEWMRGKPDANGELTASWIHDDTNLLERARQYSLNLEIM